MLTGASRFVRAGVWELGAVCVIAPSSPDAVVLRSALDTLCITHMIHRVLHYIVCRINIDKRAAVGRSMLYFIGGERWPRPMNLQHLRIDQIRDAKYLIAASCCRVGSICASHNDQLSRDPMSCLV